MHFLLRTKHCYIAEEMETIAYFHDSRYTTRCPKVCILESSVVFISNTYIYLQFKILYFKFMLLDCLQSKELMNPQVCCEHSIKAANASSLFCNHFEHVTIDIDLLMHLHSLSFNLSLVRSAIAQHAKHAYLTKRSSKGAEALCQCLSAMKNRTRIQQTHIQAMHVKTIVRIQFNAQRRHRNRT